MAIPKHIKAKLKSIENHQYAVKYLISQIENWAGIDDLTDFDHGWTWGMHVDMQGQIMGVENSETLLEEFMEI